MGRSSCSANAIAPDMGYLFRGVLIGLLFGVPAGAVGAMTAQPLIRYRISDSLTLTEPTKDSPFTRAAGLLGRCEDMLWFEDGFGHRDFLHPLAIEGFCVEGLRDYQFRQTGRDSFVMIAEKTSQGRESVIQAEIIAQMREILEEKGLGYVRFQVTFVEEILPDPRTGKKQLIMKNDAERWRAAG